MRWAVPEPLRDWGGHRPMDGPRAPAPSSGTSAPSSGTSGPAGAADEDVADATRQVPALAWTAPPAEPSQRGRGGRHRAATALVAVVVLAALATGVAVAVGHLSKPRPAAAFAQLLEDSARAHGLVEQAVTGVCRVAAPGQAARASSVADLSQAVALRSSVLSALKAGRTVEGGLPQGSTLFRWLGALTQSSIEADRHYEAWAAHRAVLGCYGGGTNDLSYEEAIRAATTATADTLLLEKTWVQVAARLGLPAGLASDAA